MIKKGVASAQPAIVWDRKKIFEEATFFARTKMVELQTLVELFQKIPSTESSKLLVKIRVTAQKSKADLDILNMAVHNLLSKTLSKGTSSNEEIENIKKIALIALNGISYFKTVIDSTDSFDSWSGKGIQMTKDCVRYTCEPLAILATLFFACSIFYSFQFPFLDKQNPVNGLLMKPVEAGMSTSVVLGAVFVWDNVKKSYYSRGINAKHSAFNTSICFAVKAGLAGDRLELKN